MFLVMRVVNVKVLRRVNIGDVFISQRVRQHASLHEDAVWRWSIGSVESGEVGMDAAWTAG